MLKNKFKIIILLSFLILTLTLPMVRAENETANNAGIPVVTSNEDPGMPTVNTENADDTLKKSDVYLTGDDITIDYIIDGNLFVVANNVTINSQIGGDAFIFANSITLGENGYIFSNLFTFCKNTTINGIVYDLYSTSETTTINGYVYRDIRIASNTVNIFGSIGRNAYIYCANLNFSKNTETENTASQGMINGNLNYSAKQEFSIPDGIVSGEITFKPERNFENTNLIQKNMMSLGTFITTVIIIWLLCLWLAPKFSKNCTTLLTTKKVLPVIGFGILAPIAGILLAILLFVLGVTSTLGILLLVTLSALMIISTSIFVITITNIICDKLKIQKNMGILGILIVSSIVLWLIGLIPYIGTFIKLIAMVLGLGIVISNIVLKNKTENIA